MTNTTTPVHLLVVTDKPTEANYLVSRLRGDGFLPHAIPCKDKQTLCAQLESKSWDLIIWFERTGLDPMDFEELVSRQTCALLWLNKNDSNNQHTDLHEKVTDIVTDDDETRILRSVEYEINNRINIQALKQLQTRINEIEKDYFQMLDTAPEAVCFIDNGMHLYCNAAYSKLFGYFDPETLKNKPLLDLFSNQNQTQLKKFISKPTVHTKTLALKGLRKSGDEISLELSISNSRFNSASAVKLKVKSLPGNQPYAEEVNQLQQQDLLTRLYNKPYFLNCLEEAIGTAIKDGAFSSLLLIVINEYLDIETTIGKSNANIVLNDIASFLNESINKTFFAARLGDCEFALLLDEPDLQDAIKVGEFIKGKINNGITSAAIPSMQLSCSVGIASINGHALDAEDVLTRARSNIQALQSGTMDEFDFSIDNNQGKDVCAMTAYLEKAISDNKFKLLFQPIVNIRENCSQGYEVLVRMLDNGGKEIPPLKFIPLANLNGIGERLDRLIIDSVLETLQAKTLPPQRIIINITNNTLISKTFLPWLSKRLQETRVPSEYLILQMSEIDIGNAIQQAIVFSRGLGELNIGKTICHFGYALDPLEYLHVINPEYVKLDNTLIRDVIYSNENKVEVQKLIQALHQKSLKVVAPQIEDVDILPLMWEIGVDYVQGFCLQAPSNEMNYEFLQEEEITLDASSQ